jgi:hypothetical protein
MTDIITHRRFIKTCGNGHGGNLSSLALVLIGQSLYVELEFKVLQLTGGTDVSHALASEHETTQRTP